VSDTVKYRFTLESRALLREHTDFFDPLSDAGARDGLPRLAGKDPEARTEYRDLPNGDREVAWVYPLDDNANPDDGRVFLRDVFTFDAGENYLKGFVRECTGDPVRDAAWLQSCRGALAANPWDARSPQVRAFARSIAKTYAHAWTDESGTVPYDLSAILQSHADYLREAGDWVRQRRPAWKLKFADPESYFQWLLQGNSVALVLVVAVDDDADSTNGRVFLKEKFLLDPATGKLQEHQRSWEAPEGTANASLLNFLNSAPNPDPTAAGDLARELLPRLLHAGKTDPQVVLSALSEDHLSKSSIPAPAFGKPGQKEAVVFSLQAMRWVALERLAQVTDRRQGWGGGNAVPESSEREALESIFRQAEAALQADPSKSPFALIQGLSLSRNAVRLRGRLLQDPLLKELNDLGSETDAAFRAEAALHFAEQRLMQERGLGQSALAIAELLKAEPSVQAKAARFCQALAGRADLGQKFDLLVPLFSREAARPSTLLGMAAAPFAGVLTESAGLRFAAWALDGERSLPIGSGFRLGASLLGMGGEALAFTGIHRGFERWSHGAETAWAGSGKEILSSLLLFGTMRLSGLGGDWALGCLGGETAGLAGQRWAALLQHGGGIAAMQASSSLSRALGWLPDNGQGFGGNLFDSALSYLQASLGYRLADGASGGKLADFHRALRGSFLLGLSNLSSRTSAASGGFIFFKPETIPSLRVYDLNQGGLQSDFQVAPGHESSLDYILFGHEGGKVRLFRDAEGGLFLEDRRQGIQSWKAANFNSFNFREQPLLFNAMPLRGGVPVRLQEGDSLFFPIRRLKISLPGKSDLYAALARLPEEKQRDLGKFLSENPAPQAWIDRFSGSPGPAEQALASHVRGVLAGTHLLHSLPTELGIQGFLQRHMEAKLKEWNEEGWWDTSFRLRDSFQDARWSPLEKSFHSLAAVATLRERLRESFSLEDLQFQLLNSRLEMIDEMPVPNLAARLQGLMSGDLVGLGELPSAAGLRQRARDLAEERVIRDFEAYLRSDTAIPLPEAEAWRDEYIRLDGKRFEIFAKIRRGIPQDDPDLLYTPEELEERLYQVLERGKPLALLPRAGQLRRDAEIYEKWVIRSVRELFPDEADFTVNPWSGENVEEGGEEAQYRLAMNVLNRHGRRPITGMPSLREQSELLRLMKKYLDPQVPADFSSARAVLRWHVDGASPKFKEMLLQANPEEKYVFLHQYFGSFWRRDLHPAQAFQASLWLGQAGMYRETGVVLEAHRGTLRAVFSLGNLDQVSAERAEDYFLLHTHPELYQDAEGNLMGLSVIPGAAKTLAIAVGTPSRDTTHMLPSMSDLRYHLQKARDYLQKGFGKYYGKTPLYDPETRVYSNWVAHPFGVSEMRVLMSDMGAPQTLEVRMGPRGYAHWRDANYETRKSALEALTQELGLPVKVEEVSYEDVISGLPWPIAPLL